MLVTIGLMPILVLPWVLGAMLDARARAHLRRHVFDPAIAQRLIAHYPRLTEHDGAEIVEGLRDYLLISISGSGPCALPSVAVALAWGAFAELEGGTGAFCGWHLRRFLLPSAPASLDVAAPCPALCRTWRRCCEREDIDPRLPERLPRLFAVDGRLASDGRHPWSFEPDTTPLCEPMSPPELVDAIHTRLPPRAAEPERRRAVAMLARRTRFSLGLASYPHDWTKTGLEQLFRVIAAREDLLVATFTDVAGAERARDRALRTPRDPAYCC